MLLTRKDWFGIIAYIVFLLVVTRLGLVETWVVVTFSLVLAVGLVAHMLAILGLGRKRGD